MINQMGNNNVSGQQQEEEKASAVEAQEKITQEVVNGDEVGVEEDDKNLHGKVEELAPDKHHSGANDSPIQNETLNGKAAKYNTEVVGVEDLVAKATEIDQTEAKQIEDLVVQPMEVPTESSDEASPVNQSQTVPSSKNSSESEMLLELNMKKPGFEASDPEISQQSIGRETEEVEGSNSISNANFTADDEADPKSDDKNEPAGNHDELQGEDLSLIERHSELPELNCSNQNQNKVHMIGDITAEQNQDKVQLIGDRTAEHLDVSLISDQDKGNTINDDVEERKISGERVFLATISINEEKLEQLWVNEDEKGYHTSETEPDFSSDLKDVGEKRVDSSQEDSGPQDKSIVLSEVSKGAGKESENEEGVCDYVESQTEKLETSFDSKRNPNDIASDSNSSTEMENVSQLEDEKTNNGANLVGNIVNYISDKSEDVMENELEVRTVLPVLTAIEPNQDQENSKEAGLGRLGIETDEENTRNQVDLRRSPSFDFDLSLGTKYEDSDQTPLLCHDKAITRSLSSRDVLTFQTTVSKNHYSRNQIIDVEEKTIRMERSDSDKPRAPFMSLLKKEGNANAFVELKQEETPLTEQATMNSTRGNGKRKPRASLFTTCICCAASIP